MSLLLMFVWLLQLVMPCHSSVEYVNYTRAAPWPLPKVFKRLDNTTLMFSPTFKFVCAIVNTKATASKTDDDGDGDGQHARVSKSSESNSAPVCLQSVCTSDVLLAAFQRYQSLLASPTVREHQSTNRATNHATNRRRSATGGDGSATTGVPIVHEIMVCISSATEELSINTDESYSFTLATTTTTTSNANTNTNSNNNNNNNTTNNTKNNNNNNNNNINNDATMNTINTINTINANTVYGALRAMETLAQLTSMYDPGVVHNTPITISDTPEYAYRGIMINPSLAFLPVSTLEHILDGMVMNKLNVLHVHWTDIASFPIESKLFPSLSVAGAYDPNAVYTQAMLTSVVDYARLRGIRVIPEFDMPGHGGWSYGRPDLCLSSCPSVLDVTNDKVYVFLSEFLKEMSQIFTDDVMMLGGDEVGLDKRDPVTGVPLLLRCFDLDAKASAWMKQHNMNSTETVNYFWNKLTTQVIPSLNRTTMVWFGVPTTGDPPLAQLPSTTIANVWGQAVWANYSVGVAHPTVLSIDSWWYLPPYSDVSTGGGMWPGAYLHDPCEELKCNDTTREFVLGGSAAQWGASSAQFDTVTWQGAVAVAERLWSGPDRDPIVDGKGRVRTDILDRLAVHSCRMSIRGVQVGFYTGTASLAGTLHWPVGKAGDADFVPRAACPSDWTHGV